MCEMRLKFRCPLEVFPFAGSKTALPFVFVDFERICMFPRFCAIRASLLGL